MFIDIVCAQHNYLSFEKVVGYLLMQVSDRDEWKSTLVIGFYY